MSAALVLGVAALLSGAAFLLGAWIGHAAAEREHARTELRCPIHAHAQHELRLELTRRALGDGCGACGFDEDRRGGRRA